MSTENQPMAVQYTWSRDFRLYLFNLSKQKHLQSD